MKHFKLNVNYLVADFVSQFNLGMIRKVRFIKVVKTPLTLRILRILHMQGIVRTIRIEDDHVLVFYKFINGQPICRMQVVSRPGKRSY
jgi:ribosomal protein S8